jgi:hypothetical protein
MKNMLREKKDKMRIKDAGGTGAISEEEKKLDNKKEL